MSKRTIRWLITAVSLVMIGGVVFAGAMMTMRWDFRKLSTAKYETNTYTITDAYTNITIITETADVVLVPSDDESTSVVCYEETNVPHSVTVADDTLVIELAKKSWWQHIGIGFGTPQITIAVPEGAYGALSVATDTGDIRIPRDFSFDSVSISGHTGDITMEASVSKTMQIGMTTGDVTMKNVVAQTLSVQTDTGDVEFEQCDAADIVIKTSTGDVTGSLKSGKTFVTKTATGDVTVPQTTGDGTCKITTDTGDIDITIE